MSKIWSIIILISIAFSAFAGNADKIIELITEASNNAVENIIVLAGMLCFWTGIFNIIRNTTIINCLSKIVKPITGRFLKKEEMNEEITQNVALNIASNALGAGNAATAFGISAIKGMQELNKQKDKPSDSMACFILLNTASIQLIPTTIISLRILFDSKNPGGVVLPVWIVSIIALASGLLAIKVLNKVVR